MKRRISSCGDTAVREERTDRVFYFELIACFTFSHSPDTPDTTDPGEGTLNVSGNSLYIGGGVSTNHKIDEDRRRRAHASDISHLLDREEALRCRG